MSTPRVTAIHDLSGFGRCSLTEVIPILSVMGVQCCPLPTAFLSTHTGGFTGFTFLDMTEELPKTAKHWKSLGLQFQAIYSGFLGSERQIGMVADFIRDFRGEIPGARALDCGNYLDHNLAMTNYVANRYLENTLYKIDEEHLIYPEKTEDME